MRTTVFCVLLAATTSAVFAADDYPIHVYPAPEAKPAPPIDGRLDDACWQSAPLVGGFVFYDSAEMPAVQTFFRVAWDAHNLYFGIQCDEPLMKQVAPAARPHDAREIFSDEAIELFLDPTHDHSHYYQFGVDAGGSLYDSEGTNPTWDSGAEVKVGLNDAGWTIELAVPWKGLAGASPRAGTVLGFNLCRDRYVGPVREWSCWSRVNANFHDPERFAHLVLSPTPQDLGKLAREFRRGDRSGPILVFSNEGFSRTSYAALAQEAFSHLDGLLAELEKTGREERDPQARRILGDLIAERRREVEALRAGLGDLSHVDVAAWTHADTAAQAQERTLREAVWQARLSALLSQI